MKPRERARQRRPAASHNPNPARNSRPTSDARGESALPLYYLLLLLNLCLFLVLLLVYVAPTHPLHEPGVRLLKLVGVTSLLTALFAMLDAQYLARVYDTCRFRPELVFVQQLVAWPVMVPLYAMQRDRLTGENRRKSMTVLTAAAVAIGMAVALLGWARERSYRPPAVQSHAAPEVHEHWPPHHDQQSPHSHAVPHELPASSAATSNADTAALPSAQKSIPANPQPTPWGRGYHIAPPGALHGHSHPHRM